MTLNRIINYYDLPYMHEDDAVIRMIKILPYVQPTARAFAEYWYESEYGVHKDLTQQEIKKHLMKEYEFDAVEISKIVSNWRSEE